MKNETNTICSISGRPCKCATSKGCASRKLDETANEAVRWAKVADVRLQDAINSLDQALNGRSFERAYPAPEWRETRRLIAAASKLLKETL